MMQRSIAARGFIRCGALAVVSFVVACASARRPADGPATPQPAPLATPASTNTGAREPAATASLPPPTVEATSLLGVPLARPDPPVAFRERQEALLAEAQSELAAAPESLDAWIWVGRRLAYLGRYRDAIAHYTDAIARFPDAPELYRHRGHRYLSVRDLEHARADLQRAVELMVARPDAVEPDGQPNERNLPTGTLRSNVWYHLGLARYLLGDYGGTVAAFTAARDAVDNPDNLVAASYWLYLAQRAADDAEAAREVLAPISADLDVIENREYHRLLLVFRGDYDAELLLGQAEAGGGQQLATVGYGIAAWRLLDGEREAAARLLAQLVAETPWPAFGHLAAEAELARDSELRRLAGL
jgi:tetratricopeptide (TPR) repeat protein